MQGSLTISLGSEELIYLLRALQIDAIEGFAFPLFSTLTSDQQALALAVADRSLRARECIKRIGPLERQVSPTIVGLFDCYAHPDSKLTIHVQRDSIDSDIHYARSGFFVVEHQETDVDVHQFTAVEHDDDAIELIGNILIWKNNVGPVSSIMLPYATLQAIRSTKDMTKIRSLLEVSLPSSIVADLAATLENPDVIYDLDLHNPGTRSLTLAQGPKGSYLLKSDPTNIMVQASPAQNEDIMCEIEKVITAFLRS
jgi:hypothetical protein